MNRSLRLALLGGTIAVATILAAEKPADKPADKPAAAADWPQWRGPGRTGVSTETGLLKEWPEDGPKLVRKITGLGGGYSTVAIVGGKIFTTGSKGQPAGKGGKGGFGGGGFGGGGFGKGGKSYDEAVICLDASTGKELWSTKIGKTTGMFAGARSTPTVSGSHVYAISSDGNLACLDIEKGKVAWKKDLKSDFGGSTPMFAYSESPLIDGDNLICTPGGDKATLVCLNKDTGKVVWRSSITGLKGKPSKGFGGGFGGKGGKGGKGGFGGGRFGKKGGYNSAGYASAVVGTISGEKTYVQFLSGGVVGISAKDGKLLWHYDNPSCGMANCSTPIIKDNAVFAASGYNNGGGRADISSSDGKFEAKEKFFIKKFVNMHGGVVLVGDMIFGTNETSLLCVDFKTGDVLKTARLAGKGSVVCADGMIYHRGEDGTVCLVEANKDLTQKGRFKPKDRSGDRTWAYPVVVGGKLYLRDWDTLLIYDVKAKD
jgi:outer membrane protein assembly factor BamB